MKNLIRTSILPVVLVFLLISCKSSNTQISKSDLRKIVEARNTKLAECFKSGDADKLALMYADSAKLSPNGLNFVYGRDSIRAFWAEDFKTSKVVEMDTKVMTIDGNSDVIYETGITTSKIIYMDTMYIPTVKYINVWRKQTDGSYLLDIDFWNKPKP